MATLATVYVGFEGARSDEQLRVLAERTIEALRARTEDYFPDLPVELEVRVEEGSIRTRAKLTAAIGAIIVFLGKYEDVRAGSIRMAQDARDLSDRTLSPWTPPHWRGFGTHLTLRAV